ncbi:hypothetical protein [Nonomuraea sp. NPDC005650]|uniref:hypothetical protein n=1 Tax=Nonomuraea sp. NPDC005650 TaxID=3157045 RepID=UPI0033ABCFF5
MTWELPPSLQWVHSLVADEAPWPRDEMTRLDGAGGLMDLAAANQGTQSQAGSAVAGVRAAGNVGSDVDVFEDSYTFEEPRMNDGALASLIAGAATTVHVVLKTIWKWLVVIALIVLLLNLIRAFTLNPGLGALLGRLRVMATRKELAAARGQVKKNIATSAVHPIRAAKALLNSLLDFLLARPGTLLIASGTALQTLFVTAGALALDPFDDNPQARRDAERVLEQTPEGRAALAYAREHGITTLYQSDRNMAWSAYNPQLNVIRIGGSETASPEALAGEFVRQVTIAKDRWDTQPEGDNYDAWNNAREKEERAANEAAYRMGSQLGHEEAARERYLEDNDDPYRNYGSGSYERGSEYTYQNGLGAAILEWPYRKVEGLFNDGPLDWKP